MKTGAASHDRGTLHVVLRSHDCVYPSCCVRLAAGDFSERCVNWSKGSLLCQNFLYLPRNLYLLLLFKRTTHEEIFDDFHPLPACGVMYRQRLRSVGHRYGRHRHRRRKLGLHLPADDAEGRRRGHRERTGGSRRYPGRSRCLAAEPAAGRRGGGRRETAYRRRRTAGATGLCADVADGLAGGDRRRCFGPEARTDRPTDLCGV